MKLKSAVLYSNNVDVAQEFYNGLLGLRVERKAGDAFISFLFDDGARLGVKRATEERERPGRQAIFVEVEDMDDWYKKVKDAGVEVLKPLTKETWGTEFSVTDPDGNKVVFTGK